jgi:MoaA/NifB/PqqE/SkfB family radical SAM enzyme
MDAAPERSRLLPADTVIRCLEDAAPLGIRTVYLTGGEPFLHPDVGAILAAVVPGQSFKAAVCTNGTLIGTSQAALLKAHGIAAQVSIDGPEAYHDRFRASKGAFAAASGGIQTLVSAGVPVTVVVTICRDNLESLSAIAEWAFGAGVQQVSVQPLLRIGRAVAISAHALSDEEMCELFLCLSDLGHRYRPRGLRFSLNYRSRSYLRAHPCAAYVCNGAQCHRGVTKEIKTLVVREDGTVLPEIPTLNPRFALGSVFEARLPDLVRSYFAGPYSQFHDLCRSVFRDVVARDGSPLVPWDEWLLARSWARDL